MLSLWPWTEKEMPRMSEDLLVKCTGQAKRKRDESKEQFLRRITHLYCSEKGIEAIDNLSRCRNLAVLYLYDNFIQSINNLASCVALTHLYLQNNHIKRIANISTLHRLTKLYLNGNAITVVEGLVELTQLSELHIAHQRLPEGEKLLFDPRTLSAISLNVLNVSGNNLDSISELQCLTELSYFSASNNSLSNMRDLNRVFTRMKRLVKLELSGNPLCQKAKYRDRIITMGTSIVMLDGHEVSDTEKLFLMNWKAMRKARRRQQKQSLEQMSCIFDETLPSDPGILSSVLAPPALPALPARQLPHRCKKRNNPASESVSKIHKLPQLILSDEVSDKMKGGKENFKLPELVPYQSIIAQQGHLMNALSNNYLPEKPWRTVEVNGPGYRM